MISPDEAVALVLGQSFLMGIETVPLLEAAFRFLATDIISDVDIPPFDNSAMDGFALVASAIRGASKENPVSLPITGEAKAGDMETKVSSQSAIRIMTGAMLPSGADTVVPVEDTSESDGMAIFYGSAKPGANIRRAGEDIRRGMKVLRRGDRITPAVMGILASLNIPRVEVFKKPDIAIIATGDELAEPGTELLPGHIRNSNAYALYGEVLKCGGTPHYLGIARDSREDTERLLQEASRCDIIITTGGVSMGEYDFVPEVLTALGVHIIFETVKMKPGKPCIFGVSHVHDAKKLFFGLPGNPVSSLVSFMQFVRPALLSLMGARKIRKPEAHATLREKITKKKGRTHFVRGFFSIEGEKISVATTGPQGSGILRSMHEANCLIILPAEKEVFEAGEDVVIQLINHEEIE